jgi:hypothetical protein
MSLGIAQAPLAGNVRVRWVPHTPGAHLDYGIGITFFATGPGSLTVPADTALVHARADRRAPVTGAFLYKETMRGRAYEYAVSARRRLEPNVLEFEYEEAGIPLDSLNADTSWARVILGFDASGAPHRGWVRLDSTHLKHKLWTTELPGRSLFFVDGSTRQLLHAPNGRPIAPPLDSVAAADYILHPLETKGSWMRVRLAVPADICVGPDEPAPTSSVGWIRYLDPKGRPLVWYYSRGC